MNKSGCASLTRAGMPRLYQLCTRWIAPACVKPSNAATFAAPPSRLINISSSFMTAIKHHVYSNVNTTCINTLLSAATLPGMTLPTEHPSFVRLLESARRATSHLRGPQQVRSESDLRGAMGISPQTANNWKRRGVSQEGALHAQRQFGTSAIWLMDGTGGSVAGASAPPQARTEGVEEAPHAHYLSDDEPTTRTWDFIVSSDNLPLRFRLAVPDDALAPSTPRGTMLIFSTTAMPAFGHGVLVQDQAGRRYVRRYAQGTSGRWIAEAHNTAYVSIDSIDGLKILAAVIGRETGEV